MSKKKQATKTEKQAVEKPPIDLSDEQLDKVQGGTLQRGPSVAAFQDKGVPLSPKPSDSAFEQNPSSRLRPGTALGPNQTEE